MNAWQKQNEAKLHILQSLARSQRALARMIESMADVRSAADNGDRTHVGQSRELTADSGSRKESGVPGVDPELLRQMRAFARYQKILAEKIACIRISRIRKGRPGKIWLNERLVKPNRK
ncbi:hypothetical protein [Paenibacillus sp. MBLB4367]|uniref:hypothetical protein n=1 Tax=Paenibacillus sp. MBLB4367 TaxID=3384767 RepID=UPI0039082F6C